VAVVLAVAKRASGALAVLDVGDVGALGCSDAGWVAQAARLAKASAVKALVQGRRFSKGMKRWAAAQGALPLENQTSGRC
jgi:hypothetical protein